MKPRTTGAGAAKELAQADVRRPLRRAAIAAAVAVLIGIGLWLSPAERPPVRSPAPPAAAAPALPAPSVRDLPQEGVTTVHTGGAQAPAPVEAAPATPPAVPEPVVLVSKPTGPVLQLGVFGAQENAERLRDELIRNGFPARLESRVVLGPFPDRSAAEAVQAALQRAGQGAGIVVNKP